MPGLARGRFNDQKSRRGRGDQTDPKLPAQVAVTPLIQVSPLIEGAFTRS